VYHLHQLVGSLLGLGLAALANCALPQPSAVTAEWLVANQTSDTLWVMARFARNSVPRADIPALR